MTVPVSINYEEKIIQLSNALQTLQAPDITAKIKNDLLKVIINRIDYVCKPSNKTLKSSDSFEIKIFLNL